MAKKDLDETNHDNLNEQERLYGDGKSIGEEIVEQNRSASMIENADKHIDGQVSQFFNKFQAERDNNLTPLQEGIRQFNSGHLIKPGGQSTAKKGDVNDISGMLPGLG